MTKSDESYFQRNIIVEPWFMKTTKFFLTAKLGTSLRVWDLGQNVEYNMIIMCLVIILLLQKLPCFMYDNRAVMHLYLHYALNAYGSTLHTIPSTFFSMRFCTSLQYA